jgi:hypothetical protein
VSTATIQTKRKARALAPALLALLAALAFAASAQALPAKFWGVVPQTTLNGEQFQRLGRGGVESMRISLDWGELQPQKGGPINWDGTDAIVERAALARIDVLPVVNGAPTWAVPRVSVPGGGGAKAPAHLPITGAAGVGWKSLLRQAIERYGPNGEFWATHPSLPVRAIRAWQVWNEQNFRFFVAHPNPTEYGKLVNLSFGAIRSADPQAQIVLGGMFARPRGARNPRTGKHTGTDWFAADFLEALYKRTPGVKRKFNAVALHPYTYFSSELSGEIEEIRAKLKSAHDSGKALWITELGWSSEHPSSSDRFAKGENGQAKEMRSAFSLLKRKQAPWRLQRVYWFAADDLRGSCNFCGGSGLFDESFEPKKSWFEYVKFAGGTP